MIFFENRYPPRIKPGESFFGTMLYSIKVSADMSKLSDSILRDIIFSTYCRAPAEFRPVDSARDLHYVIEQPGNPSAVSNGGKPQRLDAFGCNGLLPKFK